MVILQGWRKFLSWKGLENYDLKAFGSNYEKNMKKNEINSQTQVQQEKLQLRNKHNNCKSLAA